MLGLPQSTEVKRALPKAGLYKQLDWKPSQRDSFDGDVSRMDFVNWIAPRTLPAIAEGNEVKEIYVVEVALKRRNFDIKSIALLGKSIPQHIVYVLRYEEEMMMAVYYDRLFTTQWARCIVPLQLVGLNLDAVWENLVRTIGNVRTSLCDVTPGDSSAAKTADGLSLREQIRVNEEHAKIERQIALLERQMNATKQPRRKRELFIELQKIRNKL